MLTTFNHPAELVGKEGTQFGPTPWLKIEQDRVNLFADATDDHQWIHIDVEKSRQGPFGTTIAHGYLTLSLVAYFGPQLIEVKGISHAVNVGADRLRFISPVPVGSRIRARSELLKAEEIKGGYQVMQRVTIEIEGPDGQPLPKPAAEVDSIARFYPA
ncbi:MAG: MaoC family dehydratase [Proteobacteria bacterium]|nr:MaoC family dehydratase [Pseudomonadota bacterium]